MRCRKIKYFMNLLQFIRESNKILAKFLPFIMPKKPKSRVNCKYINLLEYQIKYSLLENLEVQVNLDGFSIYL